MSNLPRLYSPEDRPMWESCAEGALRLQVCSDCGTMRYPPGPACPECLSMKSEWKSVSGRATLLSWTVFHRKYLAAYPPPTLVVAVRLEEGPIMIANMDAAEAEGLRIDLPLRLTYGQHPDGYAIPRFALALAASPPTFPGERAGPVLNE